MSETGNGRKNWTRVVAAVGLVFLAVAGGIVLANANKVINKTEKKDEDSLLIKEYDAGIKEHSKAVLINPARIFLRINTPSIFIFTYYILS